jgi:hypothetical protein
LGARLCLLGSCFKPGCHVVVEIDRDALRHE